MNLNFRRAIDSNSSSSFRYSPKKFERPRVFDAVEEFDGFPIVHHIGDSSVEGLGAKQGPDPGAKREFWRGALEADTVEGEIICLGNLLVAERSGPIVHRRFFYEDFRVLYEVVPLGGVQLL